MTEYLDAVRNRYIPGNCKEKSRILDEGVQVTNMHRKALFRALRTQSRPTAGGKAGRVNRYGLEVATVLKALWEASDRVCASPSSPNWRGPRTG